MLRIITWNIQWGLGIDGSVDLRRIVDEAHAIADFDVLCLQEVSDNFSDLKGNGGANQFAELAGFCRVTRPSRGLHSMFRMGQGTAAASAT
jgi:endonuclease/exonuclease/phosphatase family metal-dependent hydrolase